MAQTSNALACGPFTPFTAGLKISIPCMQPRIPQLPYVYTAVLKKGTVFDFSLIFNKH